MSANTESWPRPHRLTIDEYYRMAEVGLLAPDAHVELIEGEVVDMPPIGSRHAAAVSVLAKRLIRAVGDSAEVRVQAPVRLGPASEPQPDIAVLKPKDDSYKNAHPQAADVLLLIEVSEATLRFDMTVKATLYARHRIQEYWVVDLVGKQLHRYRRPQGGQYADREERHAGVVHVSGVEAEIHIDDLF
jgi:Uma2 family endonuclease